METQKTVATVVGAVLTIVGIWGFFSDGAVLVFSVNTLHNVVHLVLGLLGLYFGLMAAGAQAYNKWAGVLYLVVGVVGWLVAPVAALIAANMADHVLHLVLGVVMAGVGFLRN